MTNYETIANQTRFVLERMGNTRLASLVTSLFDQLSSSANRPVMDALSCYADMAHDLIKTVSEQGSISEQLYSRLRKLQADAQASIESAISVDSPSSGDDYRTLEALHYMGGLSLLNGGSGFSFFLFPDMLPLALRLLSLLDRPARRKHILQICKLRGDKYTLNADQISNIETDVLEILTRKFQSTLKDIVSSRLQRRISLAELELVLVEYLPTATDFYEAGIAYYQNKLWTNCPYYIFATTSGVILPEEHFGSEYFRTTLPIPSLYQASGKHPIRSKYFETLAGSAQLKRFYYFEWERASAAYKKTIRAIRREAPSIDLDPDQAVVRYKNSSLESIISFLRRKNFGLCGVDHFPDEYNYLTLGNGRAVLLSGRDGDPTNQIGHGFMLHPTSGLVKSIKGFLSPTQMVRDFIPKDTIEPIVHLGTALLKGFVPVIAGALHNVQALQKRDKALELFDRIRNSVIRNELHCDVIKWPEGRVRNVKEVAEGILNSLENS